MTDEEVIKRRLLIDGDGTGDDRRLNSLIKGIIKWSNTPGLTDAENEGMYDRLLAQLGQSEFVARRSQILNQTSIQQLVNYKAAQDQIDGKITDVKFLIEESKANLEVAKILKGNRMQYDLLAQSIKQEPARSDTQKKLSALKNDVDELNDESKSIDDIMDKRRKQFYVLSSSANQIRAMLEEKKSANEEAMNTSLDDITNNSPGPEAEPMSE